MKRRLVPFATRDGGRRPHATRVAIAIAIAGFALLAGITQAAVAGPVGHAKKGNEHRSSRHIFVIMMENHGFSQIIGNKDDAPHINALARHNGLATDYLGVTHPSLPNYLATISGDFQGIWDDCKADPTLTCPPEEFVPGSGDGTDGNYLTPAQITSSSAMKHMFGGPNLVDQLEAKGLTWRAYMQSIPGIGSEVEYAPVINTMTGPATVKLYAQKHDPFMYFSDINYPGSPRLNDIVPFEGNFSADLASGDVPNFVWISPDQCHDMHGISPETAQLVGLPSCGYPDTGLDHGAIRLGDTFVHDTVKEIKRSHTWKTTDSSIVIVWDEDDYTGFDGCCGSPIGTGGVVLGGARVPLIVINSDHGGGDRHEGGDRERTDVLSNHYSLLATIEHVWHLGCLAEACTIPRSGRLTRLFES